MSLGTKSFATEGIHDKVHDKIHDNVHDKSSWYQHLWGNRSCMTGEPPSRHTLPDILSLLKEPHKQAWLGKYCECLNKYLLLRVARWTASG